MPSTFHTTDLRQGFLRRTVPGLVALPARLLRSLARWSEGWRQRRHLRELDEHMLKDIGLSDIHGRHDVMIRELHRRCRLEP